MISYGIQWSEHCYYKQDPLPDIEPALLNSLDISRYVEEGCLIEQEHFDLKRMKPASYELRFLGTLYDWPEVKNDTLEKRCRKIVEGEDIELSKNSISYLWLEERLRLPEYIAARFNLRISDVHKGLLLGTGPLIDPGFGGRILIPLHNLTDRDYTLKGGQGIIWVEFTKVSKNPYWLPNQCGTERPPCLVEFPSEKVIDNPACYLQKAGAAAGVRSAFKGALDNAVQSADHAKLNVERIQKLYRRIGIGGIVGATISLIAVIIGLIELVFSAYEISGQVMDRVHRQGERIHQLEMMLEQFGVQLDELEVTERPLAPGQDNSGTVDIVFSEFESRSEGDVQPLKDSGKLLKPAEAPYR